MDELLALVRGLATDVESLAERLAAVEKTLDNGLRARIARLEGHEDDQMLLLRRLPTTTGHHRWLLRLNLSEGRGLTLVILFLLFLTLSLLGLDWRDLAALLRELG